MTPEAPYRADGTATTVVGSPRVGSRLRLKPMPAAKGIFDGGWWPRSREPVAEFSALAHALAIEFGVVDRIGFCLASWDLAPRRLVVQEDTIRLAGFHRLNPNTVVVIGPRRHRLTLLVVPADARADAAGRALALASAQDNGDDADEILVASGVLLAREPGTRAPGTTTE